MQIAGEQDQDGTLSHPHPAHKLTEELSKTCRLSFQNKFEKLLHLVGFIVRNLS